MLLGKKEAEPRQPGQIKTPTPRRFYAHDTR
jgi:hypothetical protein